MTGAARHGDRVALAALAIVVVAVVLAWSRRALSDNAFVGWQIPTSPTTSGGAVRIEIDVSVATRRAEDFYLTLGYERPATYLKKPVADLL